MDEQQFTAIFDTHWDRVYSTALLLLKSASEAEDTAQEIFLRIWNNRDRTVIQDIDSYLFIATRNLVYAKLSRLKTEAAYRQYLSRHLDAASSISTGDLTRQIEAGISLLPPQQQTAFRLSRTQGLTHEQIAQQMQLSPGTVKDYIVRALAFLRQYLKEYFIFLMALPVAALLSL